MSASPASFLKPATHSPSTAAHSPDEVCPLCEQPIPRDRSEEIKERLAQREDEQRGRIEARLQERFAQDLGQALEAANQRAAEALQAERNAAKGAADAQRQTSERQLAQLQQQSQAREQELAREFQAKQEAIRAEATQAANAAAQAKVAELEQAQRVAQAAAQARLAELEAEKARAASAHSALTQELVSVREAGAAALEKLRLDNLAREAVIRQQAAAATEAAMQEQLADAQRARTEADARTIAAEQKACTLQITHETQLAQELATQRQILERDKAETLATEKALAAQEKLKLSAKLDDLQRQIDKKSAEELGEGPELDLFEALKAEFEGDKIERIKRGLPGGDIRHTVIHNGKECGKILYDSKNHNAWRNDFVSKLSSDQMAEKASHAILSTRKFPAGFSHLAIQDGVIIASPSRVVAVVQILRQHLLQTHTLRASSEERGKKTQELYAFITSERCTDLLARFDTHSDDLLDLQVKEKKAHDTTWKRQGELIRSVQKVRAELSNEIDLIIGTRTQGGRD
jgi:hypothetical protein